MLVVYDLDGVLNGLNEYVFRQLGIEHKLDKLKYYNIARNTHILRDREIRDILNMYGEANSFISCGAIEGADRITNVEERYPGKVRVMVNSLCYSLQAAEAKRLWLRKYTKVKEENIVLQYGTVKDGVENADIVVEDCLKNLLDIKCSRAKILLDKPYNRFSESMWTSLGITRVRDLNESIKKVEEIVKNGYGMY